jgi:hypothetical protein
MTLRENPDYRHHQSRLWRCSTASLIIAKAGGSKAEPDLPIKGSTKVAASLKKRTSGLPTRSSSSPRSQKPGASDRKPLARYGAMEGALARSLLTSGVIFGRRLTMTGAPNHTPGISFQGTVTSGEVTMRKTSQCA